MIVPSRGPVSRLEGLLDSLAEQTVEHQTLVVDNASDHGCVSELCDRYPFAEAIRLDRNEGFSRPVNIAARQADGDVIVLINDDCVCDPGFVEAIAREIDAGDSITMAAGVLRDSSDNRLIDTAGMQLDPTLLVYDYLNGMPVDAVQTAPDPVGPSAAAAAFDRAAFLAEGGFDEKIFAYWEDVDLVIRMRLAGGSCRLAREALGVHEHSASLGSGSAAKNRLMGYGRGYLLRKWGIVSPRRLGPVLARELVLVGGQAVIDRTVTGISGRIAGWRDVEERREFPAQVAAVGGGDPLYRTLARRFRRRRRLADRERA